MSFYKSCKYFALAIAIFSGNTHGVTFDLRLLSNRFIELSIERKDSEAANSGVRSERDRAKDVEISIPDFKLRFDQGDYSQIAIETKPFGGQPKIRQRWVWELLDPLPEGVRVEALINSSFGDQYYALNFKPDAITGSIQVNQAGYTPDQLKIGWAGNWTGRRGTPINTPVFKLYSLATGKSVFTGALSVPIVDDQWSGNYLYKADFTAFRTPGRYQLVIDGLGRSQPFSIGKDVYDAVAHKTFKTFLHHRDINSLTAPYVQPGYERLNGAIPAPLNAVYHPAVPVSIFANNEVAGEYHPVTGGWYDAGDFGQYVVNAAPVWHYFSTALDFAPSLIERDDFGIPESGNGIPDMLDELAWGYAWARSMQDSDGAVYSRVVSECWDDSLPQDIDKARLIYEKTTHATASFAALSAIHGRLISTIDPAESQRAIDAAIQAWQHLIKSPRWPEEGSVYKNPPGTCAGEYQDSSSLDNQLWAAAELYRTTGEAQFRDYYELNQPGIHHDVQAMPTFGRSEMAAAWAYLKTDDPSKKSKIISDLRLKFDIGGRDREKYSLNNPMDAIVHPNAMWVGWGTLAQSTRHTFPLLQAYTLTGRQELYDLAFRTPDFQLGANPLSLSFITGIGTNYPKKPLSLLQRHTGNAEPLYGLPINGPTAELRNTLEAYRQVNGQYDPIDRFNGSNYGEDYLYPVMRRYVDSEYLPIMQEPTLTEYAYTFTAYAVLNELAQGRSKLQ